MKLIGLIALLSTCSLGWGMYRNYCNTKYCQNQHLACNNPEMYNVRCAPGSRTLPMERHRNALLNALNEFRNFTAGGGGRFLKPAARMSRMSYSTELEDFARLAVITCSTNKFCLSSKDFYYVGYIHEITYYTGHESDFEDLEMMLRLIHDWTTNLDYINMKMGIYMPATLERNETAKAALIIADRNTHVGCSAMRFTVKRFYNFVFACAFATDLLVRRPLYRMSGVGGTACKRRDPIFSALCDVGEDYGNEKEVPNAVILDPPIDLFRARKMYIPLS